MAVYVICDEHGPIQGWRRTCPACPPAIRGQALTQIERATIPERIRDGERQSEIADSLGVSREYIRQLANRLDPEAIPLGKVVRRVIEREREEIADYARAAALDPCRVCLGPMLFHSGPISVTCGEQCAELWQLARLHLDNEQREKHRRAQARVYLARPDHYSKGQVAWAQRHLTEGTVPNRYIPPRGRVAEALQQIKRLRPEPEVAATP
jgi:hypothetical protein